METNNTEIRFYNEMRESLLKLRPEGMEIRFDRISKHNREKLHACSLMMPGSVAAPTFYFEELYEIYENGTAVEDLAQSLINYACDHSLGAMPGGIELEDYESVKKNLGIMVIGEEKNREYLRELIYKKIEDLALVPIIFTNDSNGTGCIKIRKDFLLMWNVTESEILEQAIKNAPEVMPPTFRNLNEIMGCEEDEEEEDEIFVVSNMYYAGGASVAFYPGFLDCIGMALGKDLFILPSSINELIILTDSGQDPGRLLEIVREVNKTQVAPSEVLTDAVYHYGRGGRGFRKLLPVMV